MAIIYRPALPSEGTSEAEAEEDEAKLRELEAGLRSVHQTFQIPMVKAFDHKRVWQGFTGYGYRWAGLSECLGGSEAGSVFPKRQCAAHV